MSARGTFIIALPDHQAQAEVQATTENKQKFNQILNNKQISKLLFSQTNFSNRTPDANGQVQHGQNTSSCLIHSGTPSH